MPKLANIKANLLVVLFEEDGLWIARCPYLNVLTHADSRERALGNLREEIEFLIAVTLENGTLADVLEHRISLWKTPAAPEEFLHVEMTSTDVDLSAGLPGHLLKRIADAPDFPA